MVVCGVDLKASEARLAIVRATADGFEHVACSTRKISLADDRSSQDLRAFLSTINAVSHQNSIDAFVIKTRAQRGQMAGGAVSFKIETLFQLSNSAVKFVSPQALARFGQTNMAGLPSTILAYQEDAFRAAAFYLSSME